MSEAGDSFGRAYRVWLVSEVYSQIEVTAADAAEALRKAEAQMADRYAWMHKRLAQDPTVRFTTKPGATRPFIARPVDWQDPKAGVEWVEMVQEFANGKDATDGFHWVART